MSLDWTRHAERGSPFMLRLIRWIALHLGRAPARLLLYPITLYFLLFAPAARRASRDYLRRATGQPARGWQVAKHIFRFAATILDRVFLLSGKQTRLDIRLQGMDLVRERLATGTGCILLGSHLGSFEVLRALAVTESRFPLKVLMQVSHNETITAILHAINPDIAGTVIPLGDANSLLKAYEFAQQGYSIGMLGDRVAEPAKTVACELLGATATFPTGPMLAAASLKLPVILFFGLYEGGRRYRIHFELFSDCVSIDRRHRLADIQAWTQKFADRLAYYARLSPYNWFNFYDFWET